MIEGERRRGDGKYANVRTPKVEKREEIERDKRRTSVLNSCLVCFQNLDHFLSFFFSSPSLIINIYS